MLCKWCGSEIPDDAKTCAHCGKDLKPEEEISFVESPTIESSSEHDYKLYLDGGFETILIPRSQRKNIYLIVEKNISSPVYGAEVQLSGPSHVDIIIKSRKLRPKKKTNKIIFPISARELGLFTLTATLTSDAGHQIVYSFIIRVEPTKYSYAEETRAKPSIRAPETSSIGTGRIVFFAIFGLIGGILLISGIINIPNLLESVFSMDGDAYPIAIPLVLSGFIVLFIAFAIGTKGKCCGCCDCCDYCS